MTRINVVPVEELSRQHLIAEYRELPRLFALIRTDVERTDGRASIPPTYRLGTGHVRFFYDKLDWLTRRYRLLVAEMERRGYHVSYPEPQSMIDMPMDRWYDYEETDEALAINRARIKERGG